MEIFMKRNMTRQSKAAQGAGKLFRVSAAAFAAVLLLGGCGFNRAAKSVGTIGGADGPTSVYVTDSEGTPAATAAATA